MVLLVWVLQYFQGLRVFQFPSYVIFLLSKVFKGKDTFCFVKNYFHSIKSGLLSLLLLIFLPFFVDYNLCIWHELLRELIWGESIVVPTTDSITKSECILCDEECVLTLWVPLTNFPDLVAARDKHNLVSFFQLSDWLCAFFRNYRAVVEALILYRIFTVARGDQSIVDWLLWPIDFENIWLFCYLWLESQILIYLFLDLSALTMTSLLALLLEITRGLIIAQILTHRFQLRVSIFSHLVWWWDTALRGRENVPTILVIDWCVGCVQIDHSPLNMVILLGHLTRSLNSAHVWEAKEIALVVALRIGFLHRTYLLTCQSFPLAIEWFFLGCSYYAHWVIQVVFVSISILYSIIPLWGHVSLSVVDYELETLSTLDENISLEAFEVVIIGARYLLLPGCRVGELAKYFHARVYTDLFLLVESIVKFKIEGRQKLVCVLIKLVSTGPECPCNLDLGMNRLLEDPHLNCSLDHSVNVESIQN